MLPRRKRGQSENGKDGALYFLRPTQRGFTRNALTHSRIRANIPPAELGPEALTDTARTNAQLPKGAGGEVPFFSGIPEFHDTATIVQ